MNASTSPSTKKPFIFSIGLHVVILLALIGFETTQTIFVSPESEGTPIIESSLVYQSAPSKPKSKIKQPEIQPEPQAKPEPEPEPEIKTNNIVAIKTEEKKPEPDKKRENELKKMAEQSLEQAFKQEKLQEDLQQDFQRKLQEHAQELKQAPAFSQSEMSQYMKVIANKVTQNWRQPIDTKIKGLSCVVSIRTVSNGAVIDVKVIESSGNTAFDRSTELAVRKSSPLPIPQNELARSQFRHFEFSFHPEA